MRTIHVWTRLPTPGALQFLGGWIAGSPDRMGEDGDGPVETDRRIRAGCLWQTPSSGAMWQHLLPLETWLTKPISSLLFGTFFVATTQDHVTSCKCIGE